MTRARQISSRQCRSCSALAVVALVVLAACGGDDGGGGDGSLPPADTGAPTIGEPGPESEPESEPDPDGESAATGVRVQAGGGLLTVEVPEGWQTTFERDRLPTPLLEDPAIPEVFEAGAEAEALVELTDGRIETSILVERRFTGVTLDDWVDDFTDYLVAEIGALIAGVEPLETPAGSGVRFALLDGDLFVYIHVLSVDSQIVFVASQSADPPTAEDDVAVERIVQSIEVDESVLPWNQHALDARATWTGDVGGDFTVSMQLPVEDWERTFLEHDIELAIDFEQIDGAGFLSYFIGQRQLPSFEEELQSEFDEFGSGLFRGEPVPVDMTVDGEVVSVWFDGDPADAALAGVYFATDELFMASYLWVRDDPALFAEILDTLSFAPPAD